MPGQFDSFNESVAAIEAVIDDTGLMPNDDGYTAPSATEEKPEEVEDEQDVESEAEEDEGASTKSETEDDEEEVSEVPKDSSEADQLFDITIDGEEYEVNLEELQGGYLRNEDYVRKLSELDKEYDAKVEALEERQAELLELYEQATAEAALGIAQFRNINWDQLKATDPDKYAQYRLAALEAEDHARAQAKRRNDLLSAHQQAQAIKHQALLKQQTELAKKIVPEFESAEFAPRLRDWGKKIGFTVEEIDSVADAKHLLVLDKARRYDEMMSKRKVGEQVKASKELPPVVKPGAPKAAGQEQMSKQKVARQKFSKTGNVRDAADLFLARGIFDN